MMVRPAASRPTMSPCSRMSRRSRSASVMACLILCAPCDAGGAPRLPGALSSDEAFGHARGGAAPRGPRIDILSVLPLRQLTKSQQVGLGKNSQELQVSASICASISGASPGELVLHSDHLDYLAVPPGATLDGDFLTRW